MKNKIKLSFSIIAHNEEHNIKRCLESIKWANEIIVVDCESTDNTVKIAKRYTNRIYKRKNLVNLNINKSYAISKSRGEWIFYIDPDEVITPQLKEEILKVINQDTNFDGFKIPRLNYYIFGFLKHGGNYPDYQLRLFRKGKGKFPNKHVHERIVIDGKIGKLKSNMLHFPYTTISEYIKKLDFYTSFYADYWIKNRKNVNSLSLLVNLSYKPIIKFFERYVLKGGFLDGIAGFFAAFSHSTTHIITYFKFYYYYKYYKQQTMN